MSEKDWRKVQAAERINDGEWTMVDGAGALGLSCRQMRRICRRVGAGGAAAVTHRGRGKKAPNGTSKRVQEIVVNLAKTRYSGFNDTHLAEKLREEEKVEIGRETLRRLLRKGGVGPKGKRRPKRLFRRRERRAQAGMLLLWDGSLHDWLEGRGPKLCLMGAVDDATGELLKGAHFLANESSVGYLRALHGLVEHHGVPWSMYMDRHSCLKRNDDNWTVEEELKGRQEPTQVGRALEELDIEPIFALSAQAKGRIERLWGTLQDRLVSELRLADAKTAEEANAVLERYRPKYNDRFGRAAKDPQGAWRSRPELEELGRICAFSLEKPVHKNNTVIYMNQVIDLPAGPGNTSYSGNQVNLRHFLNDQIKIYLSGRVLMTMAMKTPIASPAARRGRKKAAGRGPVVKKKLTFKEIASKHRAPLPKPGEIEPRS